MGGKFPFSLFVAYVGFKLTTHYDYDCHFKVNNSARVEYTLGQPLATGQAQ